MIYLYIGDDQLNDIINSIRQLAIEKKISYTEHAQNQMFARNIFISTVESILEASDNQIIEIQSEKDKNSKGYCDNKYLIYSPDNKEDVIVVSMLFSQPEPEIRVVTVERVDEEKWLRVDGGNPAILRK